jgi:RNA ligase-like protein
MSVPFEEFPKIPRLSKAGILITEKIDGTNAQIYIPEPGSEAAAYVEEQQLPFLVGSRTRWIQPQSDNYGFAQWAHDNADALKRLGYGHHFGEWWGQGIQRRYGLSEKRFSLFNVTRWEGKLPEGLPTNVGIVPVLYRGEFDSNAINATLATLKETGSKAAPGFMDPEGIIIYHFGSRQLFKKTFDDEHKLRGKDGEVVEIG